MENNERFNLLLNSSRHGRRIYDALSLFAAEPGIQQTNDTGEKREIFVGQLLTFLDEPQADQQAI